MPATSRTLRLERQLRRQLDRVLDAQTRDLVRAWAVAWDEIVPDLRDTLTGLLIAGETVTRSEMRRSQRLRRALAAIADRLEQLGEEADVRIGGDVQAVIDTAGGAQASIIDSQLPPGADALVDLEQWSRIDVRQIEAIVTRTTEKITSDLRPLAPEATDAVRRELIRGVVVGSNPRATATRIIRRAEKRFNGGLTRALTVSRTETLDAHRAAAALGQAEHADVLEGWIWLASLTPRTCRSCLAMHGRLFPLEAPGPYDHQQGRCGRMAKVKPWSDLGFDNVDEPADLTPDADAYFARLTPAQQRNLLGRDGYRAWLAGDFPREDWAKRRENDDWRPAYVPAAPGEPNAAGDGAQPPGRPPAPPLGDPDDLPPIGPVLGDARQQRYLRDGQRLRIFDDEGRPTPIEYDTGNFHHTNIADRDARATALMQYHAQGNQLVRETARAIAEGRDHGLGDNDLVDEFLLVLYGEVQALADASTYRREDLVADIVAAAHWLLAQPVTSLGTVYRGLGMDGVDPLDEEATALVLAALVTSGWWYVSASPEVEIAEVYAMGTSGAVVLLEIQEALGVRLASVGRMAPAPEVLLGGGFEVVRSTQGGTQFRILGRWQR